MIGPILIAVSWLLLRIEGKSLKVLGFDRVAAPVGLHLGWNLTSYLVFSAGPLGPGILVPANGAPRMEATGLVDFLLDVGVPLLLVTFVSRMALVRLRRPHRTEVLESV